MESWKFFDITHRDHVVCNPTSEEKLAWLVGLLRLPADAQAVDIACGKGEFLFRIAGAYDVRATGVDLSPFFIASARERLKTTPSPSRIEFIHMDGADFKADRPQAFDLASCLGASWIFGGHAGTLEALTGMVKPGGWVIVGEPYWQQEPPAEYLRVCECAREDFGSHSSNAAAGEPLGLELVHTIVSSKDDWDRYEGLQWFAADQYARAHPDDSDLAELLGRVRNERDAYLRWGRDTLGWAIYLFRAGLDRPVDLAARIVECDSPDFALLTSQLDTELEDRYPGLIEDEPVNPQDLLLAAVAYNGDRPIGCGALRELESSTAEIKRMFVLPEARRLGAARKVLSLLETQARALGYATVRLGSGVRQPEALALYESCGYRRIPLYGEYDAGDLCVCYEKALT